MGPVFVSSLNGFSSYRTGESVTRAEPRLMTSVLCEGVYKELYLSPELPLALSL